MRHFWQRAVGNDAAIIRLLDSAAGGRAGDIFLKASCFDDGSPEKTHTKVYPGEKTVERCADRICSRSRYRRRVGVHIEHRLEHLIRPVLHPSHKSG